MNMCFIAWLYYARGQQFQHCSVNIEISKYQPRWDFRLNCEFYIYFSPNVLLLEEKLKNKTNKILKQFQAYDVGRVSSYTSWPQAKDSNSSNLFGRWSQEAWPGQWGSETGEERQPINGELSNSLHSRQLKLHLTGELWETVWNTSKSYPSWGMRELWCLPTSSHLSVFEGNSSQGCYVLCMSLDGQGASTPVGWDSPQM